MMKTWWQTLSPRERGMLIIGLAAGVLFAVYQFVYLPVSTWHENSRRVLSQRKVGYEQVQLAAKLHGGQQQQAVARGADRATPLKQALANTAAQARLIVSSTDGNSDARVQLTLAPADPEVLYGWIDEVENRYGAVVIEARFSRARNNPALIKTDRLIFSRPPLSASVGAAPTGGQ
ncbi:MAG: type II secretion system protein GspM [Pseudomonadota bacterium]